MRPSVLYYVSGGKDRYMLAGMWWGHATYGNGFANYLVCKTKAHALMQYKRCKVKYRQIDVREKGKTPYVWKHGAMK